MELKRKLLSLVSIGLAFAAAGCSLPVALPESNSLPPPGNKIVIVGKIELDPPFNSELEQTMRWNVLGDGGTRNQVLLATGDTAEPIQPGQLKGADWKAYIDANWGEYFFAEIPRTTRYLNGVMTPLDVAQQDYLWFPGGLKLQLPAEGDVAYIGTLRYVRNDFNEIIDIQVHDDREQVAAALLDRYGNAPQQVPLALWLQSNYATE